MALKAQAIPEVPPRIDDWVRQYIQMRDKIAEIKKAQAEYLVEFEETKDLLAGQLQQWLDATGQESARTAAGTVFIREDYTVPLADPDAFMDYVIESQQFELLERRANKTACRAHVEEHGSLPPGVKANVIRTVNVRKPS